MTFSRIALLAALLAISSCTQATDIYTPSGQKAVLIECHGMVQSMAACFKKANEVCPNGYRPVGAGGESYPVGSSVGSGSASVSGNTGWAQSEQIAVMGTAVYRYLTVQCN